MNNQDYGPHCFDEKYYCGDRGGFKEGIDYHSESQQNQLDIKLSEICNVGIPYNTILFIGCATGNEPRYFRDKGYDATGCDISKYAIDNADSSIKNYLRLYGGMTLDWLSTDSIDTIASFDVLTIVPRETRRFLICEMSRVCSKFMVIRVSIKPSETEIKREFDGIDGAKFKLESFSYWAEEFERHKKFRLYHSKIHCFNKEHWQATCIFIRDN